MLVSIAMQTGKRALIYSARPVRGGIFPRESMAQAPDSRCAARTRTALQRFCKRPAARYAAYSVESTAGIEGQSPVSHRAIQAALGFVDWRFCTGERRAAVN